MRTAIRTCHRGVRGRTLRVPGPARPGRPLSHPGGPDDRPECARHHDPAGRRDQNLPVRRSARAGGRRHGRCGRGGGGGHGSLGQREVHAAQLDRRAGPAHRRHRHRGRAAHRHPRRERAGQVPRPAHRDHLPVLQPARRPHRGGQRAAARPARRGVPAAGAGAGRRAAGDNGPRAVPRRLPGPDVRRTASAGGDRPGPGEPARGAAGRRADRGAGHRHWAGDRPAAASAQRRRADAGAGDPRPGAGRAVRGPHGADRGRAAGQRSRRWRS